MERSQKKKYTPEDLENAKKWDDETMGPNNPGVVHRKNIAHQRQLREIRESLIEQGILPMTEAEEITTELNKLYPDAKHRTIVERKGRRYQIRYFPLEKSKSGKTVYEWGHSWVLLDK